MCGGVGKTFIEHHRDIRAKPRLNVDGALGRELMPRAVEMRLEFGTLFGDDSALGETKDLEAAAVGQQRPVPADESMESAPSCDQFVAGTQKQMVGIPENDFSAALDEVAVQRGLDRPLRADRHECRRMDETVRRLEIA